MDNEHIATGITEQPTDSFQRELADLLEEEKAVPLSRTSDAATLEAQRKQQLRQLFDGAECVDLVGHSTPLNRYLKLGDWVLSPDEAQRLASYMPASVKKVRLIGCATASTEEGRKAVEALARSGLAGAGTRNNVYMTHFDKHGVRRGVGAPGLTEFPPSGERPAPSLAPKVPSSSSQIPSPSPPASPARTYAPGLPAHHAGLRVPRPAVWLVRSTFWLITLPFAVYLRLFRGLTASEAYPHRRILWLLHARSTPMPGLLTEPLLVFEITSKQKTWTLEILFDFEYARFYSSTDSPAKRDRVYKIRRGLRRVTRTMLEKHLQQAPAGVQLKASHEEARQRGWPAPQR